MGLQASVEVVVWAGLSISQSIGYSYTAISKRLKITTLKDKDCGDLKSGAGTGTCELAFPDKREDETWWDRMTNTKMYNYR